MCNEQQSLSREEIERAIDERVRAALKNERRQNRIRRIRRDRFRDTLNVRPG